MKIIETESMFDREMGDIKVLPSHHLDLEGYGRLAFECGCKHAHSVSGRDGAQPLLTSPPVKILYRCPNGYLTFVHIKGLFRQTAVTLFSGKEEVAGGMFDAF
jgi:hypothetical protein